MRENEFLEWIFEHTPPHSAVPLGIGDDMAAVVLSPDAGGGGGDAGAEGGGEGRGEDHAGLALLKVDQVLDKVHFDLAVHTPGEVGRKAVNRCLSDCAAMACLPAAIMLAVALPMGVTKKFARELYLGCRDAAAVFDCPIVGGDTAIWNDPAQRLVMTVAALGRTDMLPLTRGGAQPGDAICVSGALGGAILGRHMTFTPRIELAQGLARTVAIHAMMDLSDGLGMDLPRLCARSKVGAVVKENLIPIHADARKLAAKDGIPAVRHALADGEDYELLFTVAEEDVEAVLGTAFEGAITRIGTIRAGKSLLLVDVAGRRHAWPAAGWEHGAMKRET